MKKITFTSTLILSVLLTATVTAAVTTGFPDVPTNHWAAGAIERLKGEGVIQGYSDGNFKPNNMISRAEVAVMMDKNNQILINKLSQSNENKEVNIPTASSAKPQVRDDSGSAEDGLGAPIVLTYDPTCVVEGSMCAFWGEVKLGSKKVKILTHQDDPLHVDLKFYQGDSMLDIPAFTTDSMLDVGSKYFSIQLWDDGESIYLSPKSKEGQTTKYYVFRSQEAQKGWQEFLGEGL